MKKLAAAAAVLMLSVSCASMDDASEPITIAPQPAAPDPRIGEMQTQLTELLERLDVMNSRLARLEEPPAPQQQQQVAAAPQQPRTFEAPRTTQTQPIPEPVAASPAAAAPQEPQRALVVAALAEDYRQAIILVGRGRHADARRGFQAVFDADPAGDLADNALFWIGETYYNAADYPNAMRYYARVINDFADQNKAPDAMFKTALAQAKTGDLALARRTFQQVIERYPYSSTASSAKAELQRIKY